jgi:ribosomal protein L29
VKTKTLREQDSEQLKDRLFELRGELSKLQGLNARGMIQKQSGKIGRIKMDIARILTVMNEKGVTE